MFKLVTTHLFRWPVVARVPSATAAGALEEAGFEVVFEALSRDEAAALTESMAAATTLRAIADAETAQIIRVVRGWSDVVDGEGDEVPFSEEALRAAAEFPWFRQAIARAYGEAMSGEAARLGN